MRSILFILVITFGCQNRPEDQSKSVDSVRTVIDESSLQAESEYSEHYLNYLQKEKELFAKTPENAWRSEDTLFIKLGNHQIKKYVNRDFNSGDDVLYTYQGEVDGIPYYLLHVQYYEGDQILLVNNFNGSDYYVNAPPVISPDHNFLATASFDLEAGYNPNELNIWRVGSDSIRMVYSIEPGDWGPTDLIWLNNDTISFTKNVLTVNDGDSLREIHTVVLRDSMWVLQ